MHTIPRAGPLRFIDPVPVKNQSEEKEKFSFENLKKYFDMPINRAALELDCCISVLKKRCREVGIDRWPYRKILSLNKTIEKTRLATKNNLKTPYTLSYLEEQRELLYCKPNTILRELVTRSAFNQLSKSVIFPSNPKDSILMSNLESIEKPSCKQSRVTLSSPVQAETPIQKSFCVFEDILCAITLTYLSECRDKK